jgi:hypothetical protein
VTEVVVITPAELRALIRDEVREALSEREARERWLETKAAAEYVGCHPVTLRKARAEGRIEAAQDGPGCNLHFSTAELDRYRAEGGK